MARLVCSFQSVIEAETATDTGTIAGTCWLDVLRWWPLKWFWNIMILFLCTFEI